MHVSHAQTVIPFPTGVVSAPSSGYYGYTYVINNASVYNVLGDVQYILGGAYGRSRFRTYVSYQSGPIVSSFDKLVLAGKVWRQYEGGDGCPPIRHEIGQKHRFNTSGQPNVMLDYLYLDNPVPAFPKIAVGKHRIVHANTTNTMGNTPSPFFVKIGDSPSSPPSNIDTYRGQVLGCFPFSSPPPSFDFDDDLP